MKMTDKKKRGALIAGLSLLCVCLICGLFIHLDNMADTPQPALPIHSQQPDGESVSVPDISAPEVQTVTPITPAESSAPAADDPAVKVPPIKDGPVSAPSQVQGDKGTAAQRQQEKENAAPPSAPPDELGDDAEYGVQPEHNPETTPPPVNPPQEAQGGDTRSDGAIYVPGFGWVENSGENTQTIAPNAGTGEIVGEM